jgi:carbon starvation protein CstA
MSKILQSEDFSYFLFFLPIIASGILTIIATLEFSTFNTQVYLAVTRNSYLFIFSIAIVCAATILELKYSSDDAKSTLNKNSSRMQILAISVLLLSAFGSLFSLGSDSSSYNFLILFVSARFPLMFSALLIILSSFITFQFRTDVNVQGSFKSIIGLVVLILSPVYLYVGHTIQLSSSILFVTSFSLVIIGLGLLLNENLDFNTSYSED